MTSRRLHISWHIAAASIGVLAGAALTLLPTLWLFAGYGWLIVGSVLFFIACLKRTKYLIFFALFGGLLIGMWRGSNEQLELTRYQPHYQHIVQIQGRVAEDVTTGSGGKQQLRLADIRLKGAELHGDIWASTAAQADIKRGDILLMQGLLDEGFGTFAGSIHRAEVLGVTRPTPGDMGRRVRDWFAVQVRKVIPEPQASLGISYTLGQSQGLSDTVSDQFRLLGLTHLLVASGSQLTLLVRFARRPLSRYSKYLAIVASFGLIGGFLLLTGLSPSMVRAALVAVFSLVAWYYGRSVHPVILLSFVAGLTVLLQPNFIWGDVGWLLSFAAFGGIVILAPLLNHYFWGEREPGFFRFLVVSTVAAQIVTVPIAIFTFGEYSPLAVLANLLILPLVSLVMVFVFLTGLVTALVPALGAIIGLPVRLMLSYVTSITEYLSSLPWSHGEMSMSVMMLLASYGIISVLTLILWRQTGHNFRKSIDIV